MSTFNFFSKQRKKSYEYHIYVIINTYELQICLIGIKKFLRELRKEEKSFQRQGRIERLGEKRIKERILNYVFIPKVDSTFLFSLFIGTS